MQLKWLVSIEWLHWYLIGSNITNPPQEICLNDVDSIMLFSLFANSEKVKKKLPSVYIIWYCYYFVIVYIVIWFDLILHFSCYASMATHQLRFSGGIERDHWHEMGSRH